MHHQCSAIEAVAQWKPVVHLSEHIWKKISIIILPGTWSSNRFVSSLTWHCTVIFTQDFTSKAIHLIHVDGLMVAARHEKVAWIKKFEAKKRKNAFNREWATIYKVSVEEIWIRFRWKSIDLKNVEKIIELTVNVTTYGELVTGWNLNVNQCRLGSEKCINIAKNLQQQKLL